MSERLLTKLADVLVAHSVQVSDGDVVLVHAPTAAAPLVRALYRRVLAAGGLPEIRLDIDRREEVLLAEASDAQLAWLDPALIEATVRADCRIIVLAPRNTRGLSSSPVQRRGIRQRAGKPLLDLVERRTGEGTLRPVVTVYPTQALAQEAGMSLGDYEDFVAAASLLDAANPVAAWDALGERAGNLSSWLGTVSELRVVGSDTDLTMSVRGRTWVPACGRENFPDGEVFTAPHEASVEGTITFDHPTLHNGQALEDVRLSFRSGEITEATARRGQGLLGEMLGLDDGASRVGEFAFGLNEAVQRFTGEPLFDEKIDGTVHLALGSAYQECGGTNQSALHWDIVKDLRGGGEVYADGELVYRDGRFLGRPA
ncbi:MAG: aminopeptidase [Gaiellales bacterium]